MSSLFTHIFAKPNVLAPLCLNMAKQSTHFEEVGVLLGSLVLLLFINVLFITYIYKIVIGYAIGGPATVIFIDSL